MHIATPYMRRALLVKTRGFLYFALNSFMAFNTEKADIVNIPMYGGQNVDSEKSKIAKAIMRGIDVLSLLLLSQRIYRSLRYEFCCNIIKSRFNSSSTLMIVINDTIIKTIFIV